MDRHDFPDLSIKPIDQHAVDFIIETADKHQGKLVLATIGPETNIANKNPYGLGGPQGSFGGWRKQV